MDWLQAWFRIGGLVSKLLHDWWIGYELNENFWYQFMTRRRLAHGPWCVCVGADAAVMTLLVAVVLTYQAVVSQVLHTLFAPSVLSSQFPLGFSV